MIKFTHTKNSPLFKGGIFCFLFLFMALSACIKPPFFDRNVDIKNQSWSNTDIKEFTVPIQDTLSTYTLYLNTRHDFHYPLSNLALSVQETSPDKKETTYRVTLQLAEPDGRWKGIGSGNIFNNQVIFLKSHHFSDTGTYVFNVKPIMTLNPLPGVINIGLRIDKHL